MSCKSIAWILALVSLSVFCTPRNARAGESSTLTFTGYVAPACMVTTIDSNAVLPAGANPSDYVLLRCNTGEPDRVVLREGSQSSQNSVSSSGPQINGESITIVP